MGKPTKKQETKKVEQETKKPVEKKLPKTNQEKLKAIETEYNQNVELIKKYSDLIKQTQNRNQQLIGQGQIIEELIKEEK